MDQITQNADEMLGELDRMGSGWWKKKGAKCGAQKEEQLVNKMMQKK